MNVLLLRLCGVKIENAANIAGAELVLRNSDVLGWVLLAAAFVGAFTWWSYWRQARDLISPAMRRALTALRAVSLFRWGRIGRGGGGERVAGDALSARSQREGRRRGLPGGHRY